MVLLSSPSNGCVKQTVGSQKNSVVTYARGEKSEPLEKRFERAIGALRFSKKATLQMTPFEAQQSREANTVLRNQVIGHPGFWFKTISYGDSSNVVVF